MTNYHIRMERLMSALDSGKLGNAELAELFCGKANDPLQAAIRDRNTRRVRLVDVLDDGTVVIPAEEIRIAA